MALRMEDRFPIVDILEQTPVIPDDCQWAIFLRNHDELTLEMVTDEERDYMYRVYAHDPQMRLNLGIRRRLSPLLGNHRRRIELMNGLLMSMPGTPIIYYGDEIGMGDNIFLGDRNGVRTPMQWSADRNAGFSKANPHRLYLPVIIDPEYHYEVINVEAQENNRHSLLWWMKRLIGLRKRFKAFSRGNLEFLHPENPKILAFTRCYQDECILVVCNLSRYTQYVELDLSAHHELIPVELFGRTQFPPIGDKPYFLSMGPHSFYWFMIQQQEVIEIGTKAAARQEQLPILEVKSSWDQIFRGKTRNRLETLLPDFVRGKRWFGGKAQGIKSAVLQENLRLQDGSISAYITFVTVDYMDGNSETYVLPMAYASGHQASKILHDHPQEVLARVQIKDTAAKGVLFEALAVKDFGSMLLKAICRRFRRKGIAGELVSSSTPVIKKLPAAEATPLEPSILGVEQSNTSVVYGTRFILKLFRRLLDGINPDLEIGRFLTRKNFAQIPQVAGALEYHAGRQEPKTLAILQEFVANQGDAWEYTLHVLEPYFEHILERRSEKAIADIPQASVLALADQPQPSEMLETMGIYLEAVQILARRTAELHLVLASAAEDVRFAPEPFTKLYQRSLYQSMRTLAGRNLPLLQRHLKDIATDVQQEALQVLALKKDILDRFYRLLDLKITGMRIRCHGDYHLGQVLYTGKDFVIIDFEGEPARPIGERRIKRSPLRDVAGMLRSFHYAAYAALIALENRGILRPEELPLLESWANYWYVWVCAAFVKTYLAVAADALFLPASKEEMEVLLDALLLEKAVYELGYELNNRPGWVKIPIQGIRQLMAVTAQNKREAGNEK
jgi:maltose alpha-D-glucosyltransferase/alpha-amylase